LYSGRNAVTTIRYVMVPSPSKATIKESTAVPITIFRGSPPTIFIIFATKGSNNPVSINTPK